MSLTLIRALLHDKPLRRNATHLTSHHKAARPSVRYQRDSRKHTHTHSHRCVSVQLDWGDARYRDDVVVVVVTAGVVAVAVHPVRDEHADAT